MTKVTASVAGLSLLVLAGCGGSTSGTSMSRVEAAEADFQRLEAMRPTSVVSMPTRGSARFEGLAAMLIDPVESRDNDDINLIGDATLDADFTAGTVTGRIVNFQGIKGASTEPPADADLFDVAGQVRIGNRSSSIGQGGHNLFAANYNGQLTTPDDTYTVRGTLDGQFLGNRTTASGPDRVKGVFAFDLNGFSLDSDGDDAPVFLGIAAPSAD